MRNHIYQSVINRVNAHTQPLQGITAQQFRTISLAKYENAHQVYIVVPDSHFAHFHHGHSAISKVGRTGRQVGSPAQITQGIAGQLAVGRSSVNPHIYVLQI